MDSQNARRSSRPGEKKPRKESLARAIRQSGARLLREFARQAERDPAAFKRRAVRIFQQALPPHSGRPCDLAVTRAIRLRSRGVRWSAIYAACIPESTRLDPQSRREAQSRLRAAVRSRQNARRRRRNSRRIVSLDALRRSTENRSRGISAQRSNEHGEQSRPSKTSSRIRN